MDLGFETVGNATLVCHDAGPLLVTDPWVRGQPYFGSWTMSHAIPTEVLANIEAARFVWYSHGHPDHFDHASLDLVGTKTILIGDHVGGRLADALVELGHTVQVLPDRKWLSLTERVRVQCISDHHQDSILLVDFDGRVLVMNVNDASDGTWRSRVRKIAERFDRSFLLRLAGFGDVDMINFFTEAGVRVPTASTDRLLGPGIARSMQRLGARSFVPFSSMHQYQRTDSDWANSYRAEVDDFGAGFPLDRDRMLPAFVRYDVLADQLEELAPDPIVAVLREPEEFGDVWSDELEGGEVEEVRRYFAGIQHLSEHFGFVQVRVGGQDHTFGLGRNELGGITFEVPRGSLLKAVRYEIFDDLLIGNFMKTTLHGRAAEVGLYPDFSPYVGKYADNGRARSAEEVARYLDAYRRRSPYEFLRHRIEQRAIRAVRPFMAEGTAARRLASTAYRAASRKI